MKAGLLESLRCPSCSSRSLFEKSEALVGCRACNHDYKVVRGVPVLLTSESEERIRRFYARKEAVAEEPNETSNSRPPGWLRRFWWILEPPTSTRWGDGRAEQLHLAWTTAAKSNGDQAPGLRVLTIGNTVAPDASGPAGQTVNALSSSSLRMDIVVKPDVDFVADGYNLPFPDGSLDLVVAQATLKHLPDPVGFLSEVRRVLRGGGALYAEFAYLLAFHRWPGDYLRYTPLGIREVLKGFELIEVGSNRGPGYTVAEVLGLYLSCLLSFNNRYLYSGFKQIFGWLFHPIRHLDFLLKNNKWADQITQVNYCVAKKATVSDAVDVERG